MNLLIPPPVVTAICAATMWAAGRLFPSSAMTFAGQRVFATSILIAALVIMLVAAYQFMRARTTINPMKPARASALMTHGVFARSRNPIYLADLMVLIALAVWIGNPWTLIACVAFVVYITRFQIRPEETALTERFGDDYRRYQARVRRWI